MYFPLGTINCKLEGLYKNVNDLEYYFKVGNKFEQIEFDTDQQQYNFIAELLNFGDEAHDYDDNQDKEDSYLDFIKGLYKSNEWKNFVYNEKVVDNNEPQPFYIILPLTVDNADSIVINSSHTSEDAALEELHDLASNNLGVKFGVFKLVFSAMHTVDIEEYT